jgi:hypothetical protein
VYTAKEKLVYDHLHSSEVLVYITQLLYENSIFYLVNNFSPSIWPFA